MPDQPPPHRRFQYRLRTLMIVVTAVAIIAPTVPLLTRSPDFNVYRDNEIDLDAVRRTIAVVIDAITVCIAIWLVRRKK